MPTFLSALKKLSTNKNAQYDGVIAAIVRSVLVNDIKKYWKLLALYVLVSTLIVGTVFIGDINSPDQTEYTNKYYWAVVVDEPIIPKGGRVADITLNYDIKVKLESSPEIVLSFSPEYGVNFHKGDRVCIRERLLLGSAIGNFFTKMEMCENL